jgi:hypothetical protein
MESILKLQKIAPQFRYSIFSINFRSNLVKVLHHGENNVQDPGFALAQKLGFKIRLSVS